MSEPDWDKVEAWESRIKWIKKLIFFSVSIFVIGYFFPWVTWTAHRGVEAGTLGGLDILTDFGRWTGARFLIPITLVALYLAHRKEKLWSELLITLVGLVLVSGAAFWVLYPWDILILSDPPTDIQFVSAGAGVYIEFLGGLWVFLAGLFSFLYRYKINDEARPEPPY